MRRPTAFSTQTRNEDQTLEPGDVRLWDEPFGKGASGRVFKAVYLPLCQVLAVKVVNRLDNENVKQVLGEFRDKSVGFILNFLIDQDSWFLQAD